MPVLKRIKKFTSQALLSCVCFLCIALNSVSAQQITCSQVSPPEGSIFGSFINGTSQDLHGYMWFASFHAGLHRFDGYRFVTYSHDPKNQNSLSSNAVTAVYADRKGMIWAGTQASGLDRFDPGTGLFTNFRHDTANAISLSNDSVTSILEDHMGDIWVGTRNGLNRLDQKTGSFIHYQHHPNDSTSLSDNRVQVLYKDRQGTLWVGTGAQHLKNGVPEEKGGLNRFNRMKGNFTRYLHHPGDPNSLFDNRVGAIFEDSQGTFWVSTAGTGLHTMNRAKGTFERHPYDPVQPGKLSQPPPHVSQDLDLFFVQEDGSGAVWAGASGGWITRYDSKTKTTSHYNSLNGDVQEMEAVSGAFTSWEGVLWITTWTGNIYRVDPFQISIPHFFLGRIVHNIHEDVSGALWIGAYGEGLIRINRDGTTKRFKEAKAPFGLPPSLIGGIYEENDSIIWFGSENLYRYNRKTQIFRSYHNDPQNENSLSRGSIRAILEDEPGSLWIGTNGGLDHFDSKRGIFKHWRHYPGNSKSLSIISLVKDHAGNLWIGTLGILYRFNPKTGEFKHFNCAGYIGSIVEDFEHIIWVGTTTGLYRSNPEVDSFYRFTNPRIAITPITVVSGIVEDDQQNLWVGSTAGIFRLNRARNEISVYNKNQGVDVSTLSFYFMKAAKSRSGKLFFANRTGYYFISPDQIKSNTHRPQIVINNFWLADQPVKPGKDGPLKQPVTQTKEISLNHTQHTFSFDFAGIHYSSPEDNQLFFMLENLENSWKKAGHEKKAWYYNVPPGHYIFRVKAASKDGVWADKAITIIINPPWYRMWWAYVMYVFGFIVITWMFASYRSRRLKAENLLLEEKVIKRTHELEQSMEEKYELSKKIESQQALLNERLRISRELHDDIGSTLGSISIYSEVAKKRIEKKENTNEVLSKIGLASRELIDKMSDIVWSLNPGNESFEQLQNRMRAFAAMILAPQNIQYDFMADEDLKKRQFTAEQLKNIFLIFKEALHNIVKYADCKTVRITLCLKNNDLMMTITDDGKGFDAAQINANKISVEGEHLGGNGIKNMNARAEDMNAGLCIHSKINEGTTVQLVLHL